MRSVTAVFLLVSLRRRKPRTRSKYIQEKGLRSQRNPQPAGDMTQTKADFF